MEASQSARLDKWRDFFRTANSDIFEIIEQGIMVATSDCPKEFRIQRDRIAQTLFSCKLNTSSGCDNKVELALASNKDGNGAGEVCNKSKFDRDAGRESEVGGSKGRNKVNSTTSREDHIEINLTRDSNIYSHGDSEVLTEDGSRIIGDVLRIKEILDYNSQDEFAGSVLYDSLRRLQVMGLCVETLKATQIGKSVKALQRNHAMNPDIHHLARTLVHEWRATVHAWVNATTTIAAVSEATPEPNRCIKPTMEEKVHNDVGLIRKKFQQKSEKAITIPKRPEGMVSQQCFKPRPCDEASKFTATKRKIQESYQQVENAKRQRRVQVIQLHDVPKKSLEGHKIAHMKPGSNQKTRSAYQRREHMKPGSNQKTHSAYLRH